jgi:ribosomal protein L7Ae-like RNA K-turn-binding protein
MTDEERIYGMIGLARRGKYICYGDDLTFRVHKKQVGLVIIATDISERSYATLISDLDAREVQHFQMFTKEQLGGAIGHDPVSAIGIRNSGIMKRIMEFREKEEEKKNVQEEQ